MSDKHDKLVAKQERLLGYLGGLRSLAVGFSGGIDSTLLLAAARKALGDRVIAVTAESPRLLIRVLGLGGSSSRMIRKNSS